VICVTISLYSLAHELGATEAKEEFESQLKKPTRESLPVVRTLARLKGLDDLVLSIDTGSGTVGKMRSRQAIAAADSGADIWISIDDDIEATFETLTALVEAVRGRCAVCMAPYWLRAGLPPEPSAEKGQEPKPISVVSVAMPSETPSRTLEQAGARIFKAQAGGFGLVAMSRPALEATLKANAHLRYLDDDGVERIALFYEVLERGRWWGEDMSFFYRLPPEVEVEALGTGHVAHAGEVLNLSQLELCPRMGVTDDFRPAPTPAPAADVGDGIIEAEQLGPEPPKPLLEEVTNPEGHTLHHAPDADVGDETAP